jgi:hypothetical protein
MLKVISTSKDQQVDEKDQVAWLIATLESEAFCMTQQPETNFNRPKATENEPSVHVKLHSREVPNQILHYVMISTQTKFPSRVMNLGTK